MSEQVENKAPISTKKKRRRTIILSVLALVVVIVGSMLSVGIYAKLTMTEGTVEPVIPPAKSLSQTPANTDEVLKYFDSLFVSATDSKKVKTNMYTDIQVNDLVSDDPESDSSIIAYIKDPIKDSVKSYYPSHDGDYGDGFKDIPQISLTSKDVVKATCEQDKDTEDDKTLDDYYNLYVECGTVSFPVAKDSSIYTTFTMDNVAIIEEKIQNDISSQCKVVNSKITPTKFYIEARANRLTDELVYAKFAKEYNVSLTLEFIGDYSNVGTKTFTFSIGVYENYNFEWAGISFTGDVTKITTHDDLPVSINAKVSSKAEKSDYKLTFSSSDENIVTIDNEGNIKGVKENTEPAIITARLEYLGNTYTATCEVYCITKVDKVNVEPAEAELKVGDTVQLNTKIKPADATIKTVKWFTEDEKTATVSDDGLVTAIGKGTTKVYCVTDDGYFRASCVITIN